MPGMDGTGPLGQGPRTGRGMGRCIAPNIPVNAPVYQFYGRGGFGRGRGFRRLYGMGYNRWLLAQQYGDPARAQFGCGPCGEAEYRMYVQQQNKNQNNKNN